ncbi:MAG: nicotinamide mononucleotide transporter family protein, partial [Muribaculaceae bacterium]|nr:nicotinamide mononucleotide transporter family protein [Muribaculaceae bacterium]
MLSNIPWDIILETLGFSVGLLYLWWEYHADSRLWFASIVMPSISMWIYLHKGLYADFAINIYYFLIDFYGYISWPRAGRVSNQENHAHAGT